MGIHIRTQAAEILGRLIIRVGTGSSLTYASILEILGATLLESRLPLPSLIGAVLGTRALGGTAINQILAPILPDMIEATRSALLSNLDGPPISEDISKKEILEYLRNVLLDQLLVSLKQKSLIP